MFYQIQFFNKKVKDYVESWPVGVAASFVRIAKQIAVSGPPPDDIKLARKRMKEIE